MIYAPYLRSQRIFSAFWMRWINTATHTATRVLDALNIYCNTHSNKLVCKFWMRYITIILQYNTLSHYRHSEDTAQMHSSVSQLLKSVSHKEQMYWNVSHNCSQPCLSTAVLLQSASHCDTACPLFLTTSRYHGSPVCCESWFLGTHQPRVFLCVTAVVRVLLGAFPHISHRCVASVVWVQD